MELYKFKLDTGVILILLSEEIYKLMYPTLATQVVHSQQVPVWGMIYVSTITIMFALTNLCVTSHIQGQLVQYATKSRATIPQANKVVRNATQIQILHLKWRET